MKTVRIKVNKKTVAVSAGLITGNDIAKAADIDASDTLMHIPC